MLISTPVFGLVERRVERTFDAGESVGLKIDTTFGAVNVREVEGATTITVAVIQTADVETEAEMDRRLKSLDLEIRQAKDGAVRVDAHFRRPLTWSWQAWPPVTLVYEIQVPKRCDVKIRTGEGQITVGSLQGRVELISESGGIFTREIDGSVLARSRSGATAITACTGPITVSSDTGNITVGRAGGRAELSSRGGYIELQRAGGEVVVRGNGSDAQVGFVAPIRHAADISTSGGSLVVQVENTGDCTLDLRASVFGKVSVRGQLPVVVTEGGEGKSSLRGVVNEGGARIQARASGGNVMLRGVEPLPATQVSERTTPVKGDAS